MPNNSLATFTAEYYITQLKRMITYTNAQTTTTTQTMTTVDSQKTTYTYL